MTTVLHLPFPPSANNLFINGKKGRFRSQRYDSWIQEAGYELRKQKPQEFKGPVSIAYEFQEGRDNRKRDLGNLEKATTDLLVSHGVIEADDNTVLRKLEMAWSREAKGVRITISSVASAYPETSQGQHHECSSSNR